MDKVIFLDIDGVLISAADPSSQIFVPEAKSALLCLIEESGAKVVVSSTWVGCGKDVVIDLFQKNGIDLEILLHEEWTSYELSPNARREADICEWLELHPDVKYTILDDLPLYKMDNFVEIDPVVCMTEGNYRRALEYLKG